LRPRLVCELRLEEHRPLALGELDQELVLIHSAEVTAWRWLGRLLASPR
jgi:hypothetical protein